MAKHTEGPWHIMGTRVFEASGREVAVATKADVKVRYNADANARLIAAAPDLLEALKELVKANEEWNRSVEQTIGRTPQWTDSYLDAAHAAIAKAEGEDK